VSHILQTLELIEIVSNADYKADFAPREVVGSTVKARLLPAIKHPVTGKLHTGKRGDTHDDLMMSHLSSSEYDKHNDNYDYHDNHTGYYDPHSRKFYASGRTEVDTTDLMTKSQRVRRYGSE
jgi:hypothetical protein